MEGIYKYSTKDEKSLSPKDEPSFFEQCMLEVETDYERDCSVYDVIVRRGAIFIAELINYDEEDSFIQLIEGFVSLFNLDEEVCLIFFSVYYS